MFPKIGIGLLLDLFGFSVEGLIHLMIFNWSLMRANFLETKVRNGREGGSSNISFSHDLSLQTHEVCSG